MDWKVNFHHYGDVPVLRLDLTNTTTNTPDFQLVENSVLATEGRGDRTLKKAEALEDYKTEQEDEEMIKKLERDIRELREKAKKEEQQSDHFRRQMGTYQRRNTALRDYMKQRLGVIKSYRPHAQKYSRNGPVPLYLMQPLRDCEWEEDAVLPDDRYFDPFSHWRRKSPKNPNKTRGPFV